MAFVISLVSTLRSMPQNLNRSKTAAAREALHALRHAQRAGVLGIARPRAGLYPLLFRVVPMFLIPRARQTGLVVTLVLALFAAFGVAFLRGAGRSARRWSGDVERRPLAELARIPRSTGASRVRCFPRRAAGCSRECTRGAVAHCHFTTAINFHFHTIYMVNSTVHWRPLRNIGYSDFSSRSTSDGSADDDGNVPAGRASSDEARRTRYIVIHRNLYGGERLQLIEGAGSGVHAVPEAGRVRRPRADPEIVGWPNRSASTALLADGRRLLSRHLFVGAVFAALLWTTSRASSPMSARRVGGRHRDGRPPPAVPMIIFGRPDALDVVLRFREQDVVDQFVLVEPSSFSLPADDAALPRSNSQARNTCPNCSISLEKSTYRDEC